MPTIKQNKKSFKLLVYDYKLKLFGREIEYARREWSIAGKDKKKSAKYTPQAHL
jgi:hypothetical protein